eukprot:2313112-Prymnesium_polylepis.1
MCGAHSCVRTHVRAQIRVTRDTTTAATQRVRSHWHAARAEPEAAHPSGVRSTLMERDPPSRVD